MKIALTFDKMENSSFSKLLKYLYENSVDVVFTVSDDLMKLLISSIEEKLINYLWLTKESTKVLVNALRQSELDSIKKIIFLIDEHSNTDIFNKYMTPTPLFRSYCGDEWLVSGKINRKSAVDFLEYQITLRKMNVMNDMIDPDEWLKTLLNVDGRIYRGELCTLVNIFFES